MLLATTTWSCLMVLTLLSIGISDVLYRAIPNSLTLTVLVSGLVYWTTRFGLSGAAFASAGVLTGLCLLLAFYVVGWLGAGDVKIFGALGAMLGAHNTLMAALLGLLLGGLLSLYYLDGRAPRWHLLPAGQALRYARDTGRTVPLAAALAGGAFLTQVGFLL